MRGGSIITTLAVFGVADGRAAGRANGTADQGAFESAAALAADDAADGCAAEAADDGPFLGGWSHVFTGGECGGGEDGEEDVFHKIKRFALSQNTSVLFTKKRKNMSHPSGSARRLCAKTVLGFFI